MKKRSRKCACPCKKGAPKSACGLKGLRRGVSCPCSGPLRGLRGTSAQHQDIAAREIGLARKALRAGDCVSAMDHAVTARENARWGSGLFERAEADEVAGEARKCLSER